MQGFFISPYFIRIWTKKIILQNANVARRAIDHDWSWRVLAQGATRIKLHGEPSTPSTPPSHNPHLREITLHSPELNKYFIKSKIFTKRSFYRLESRFFLENSNTYDKIQEILSFKKLYFLVYDTIHIPYNEKISLILKNGHTKFSKGIRIPEILSSLDQEK